MPEPTPTQNSADALTPLAFAIYGNPRVYALLLGSGLSRAAGIPTGHGITLDLVRRVAIAQGEKDQPDWGAWYKDKFGNAARDPLGDAAQRIVNHRGGQVVSIADADAFFGKLRDQVQTLAQTHRHNPRNVDLLVSTAKRFAADHDHRIDLHDLIETEVQRCLNTLRTSTPDVDTTGAGAERLIAFQVSSTESLARTLGVLGRWGDGTEHDSVVSGLVAVWLHAGESKPAIAYLRYYPAVLLLWAYGIGLTIARRWRDLHHLLSHPVHTVHGGPHRFVYVVSEWLLEGYRNEIWERLPDLQGRTPDSDHRYGVLDGWRNSFAAVMPDFEDLHDTWEILFALIYCEHAPGETDRQSMHFWAPIGRNVSRWASRDRILARITDGDLHDDLVLRQA